MSSETEPSSESDQQRPSIEAILRTCAEIWDTDINNVRFTMHRWQNQNGAWWMAMVDCIVGPKDDNRCFAVDEPSELATMIELNRRVSAKFCESRHANANG